MESASCRAGCGGGATPTGTACPTTCGPGRPGLLRSPGLAPGRPRAWGAGFIEGVRSAPGVGSPGADRSPFGEESDRCEVHRPVIRQAAARLDRCRRRGSDGLEDLLERLAGRAELLVL